MTKKNAKGGKNYKKAKNNTEGEKRELVIKEEGQEYGQVLKMLGGNHIEIQCFDGVKRMGNIRGKMRKKVWIATQDIVLVSLRDYQDDKVDVILRYRPEEAKLLKAYGQIDEKTKINEASVDVNDDDDDDDNVEFEIEDI
jgi:translation initiation factor 1A